jgi:hypothetical protein
VSGLSTRLNSIQVSDPALRLFLQSLAKAVDRINVNFHLDINEPTALSEPITGASALAAVVNVPPAIMIVKSLRFIADKNGLYQASAMTQGARAWRSTAKSIATATLVFVDFDTDIFDTDDMHDVVTNNTRLTFNTAGIYIVGCHGQFEGNVTGVRQTAIRKNGTTYLISDARATAPAANTCSVGAATVAKFDSGDYIEMLAYQESGVALNLNSNSDYTPILFAHRLS